jgi:membrane-associated protease RseP (regulator of RpoE activity)
MLNQLEVWVVAVGLLIFWFLVHLLDKAISLEKYGVKVSLVVVRHESQRFRAFLYKASQRGQKYWKVFSNLSVALGGGLLIFAVYYLVENLLRFVQPGAEGSPVLPILPGLTIRIYWFPYFFLAFLVAALTHEAAHGIVALIEGIKIKSAGLFFALILPGGFVESNEEVLEKSSTAAKMRFFSAGSSINLLVALLAFLAMSLLFSGVPSGIVVTEFLAGGPIEQGGVQRWDGIFAVNGTRIETAIDFNEYMTNVSPGDSLILSTSRGDIPITAASHPEEAEKAIIGFVSYMLYYPSRLGLGFFLDTHLHTTLNWVFLILVSVAIVNMLPIPLFDGDKFLGSFLQKYVGKEKWIRTFFNAAALFLIVANIVLSMESGLFNF